MEDTLGETLCSVIPIRRNRNQRRTGGRARIHLQPQTLYSRRKNTAVHTHLRLYEAAGRRWTTSCRDLLKSDWICDVKAPSFFLCCCFFFVKQCLSHWPLGFVLNSSLKRLFKFIVAIIVIILVIVLPSRAFYLPSSSCAPPANSKTSSATLRALTDPQKRKINTACIPSRKILLLSILLYNGFHY